MKANFFLLVFIGIFTVSCAKNVSTTSPGPVSGGYSEIAANGRIYVIGSKKMLKKYENLEAGHAPHLPYTQTYLGLGSNGETVIIENEKKGAVLKERLLASFCNKSGNTTGPCAM